LRCIAAATSFTSPSVHTSWPHAASPHVCLRNTCEINNRPVGFRYHSQGNPAHQVDQPRGGTRPRPLSLAEAGCCCCKPARSSSSQPAAASQPRRQGPPGGTPPPLLEVLRLCARNIMCRHLRTCGPSHAVSCGPHRRHLRRARRSYDDVGLPPRLATPWPAILSMRRSMIEVYRLAVERRFTTRSQILISCFCPDSTT
jgi:hypothetical protein